MSANNICRFILAEFDHRHNFREMTDGERTIEALKKTNGKRLMYHRPIN